MREHVVVVGGTKGPGRVSARLFQEREAAVTEPAWEIRTGG